MKKGEKGIAILAPLLYRKKKNEKEEEEATNGKCRTLIGFKVAHVFDVSQTEGEELPEFASVQGNAGIHITRIRKIIHKAGISLTYEHLSGGALGESSGGAIREQPNLEPAQEFSALVHENAHELLHEGERRTQTTKTIRETEAEAVAYVVCRHIGLETSTAASDYIQLYRGT